MNDQIKAVIKLSVLQFIKGQTLEKNKIDFKSKWYNLSWRRRTQTNENKEVHNHDYYEFLKDCTSIINSYGRDDGFIIIGVDEKTKQCIDTNIEDSGLDDPSKIKDIIIGNVDKAFLIDIDYVEVEGKRLSVVHIPPSTDKPHLIEEYWSKKSHKSENIIWIRNGSGAIVAKRGDIDRMYWERSNITLDKKIEVSFNLQQMRFDRNGAREIVFIGKFSIENLGTKKLLINRLELVILKNEQAWHFYENHLLVEPLSLAPNEPREFAVMFLLSKPLPQQEEYHKVTQQLEGAKRNLKYDSIIATLANYEKILAVPILNPGS